MEDWELSRIYVWIRAAAMASSDSPVKYFIDLSDKSLFNLIQKNNEWQCILHQEISVSYSKEQIKLLETKIESLKNNKNDILELPQLDKAKKEHIQKTKSELEIKRSNNVEYDWMEYQIIIYSNPVDLGIEWLKKMGVEINGLSRIGF